MSSHCFSSGDATAHDGSGIAGVLKHGSGRGVAGLWWQLWLFNWEVRQQGCKSHHALLPVYER